MALGRRLSKVFKEKNVVEVDDMRVVRTESSAVNQHGKRDRSYRVERCGDRDEDPLPF